MTSDATHQEQQRGDKNLGSAPAGWDLRLENALVRELLQEWRFINDDYFRGLMRPPVLQLSDAATRLGQWRPEHRVLEISRALVVNAPWGDVLEVLKHEAAHQYVHEVIRKDESAHGPTFQAICETLHIDPAAAGTPRAVDAAAPSTEIAVIRRVQKLLALAESPNQHEAENAASTAQRLMLKYNIDASQADVAAEVMEGGSRFGYRHLGQPTGRVFEHQRWLAVVLGEHFFVDVIWVSAYVPLTGKRGSVLEICGTPPNLAMAEFVFDFLLSTSERLWWAHKRDQDIRSNRDRLRFMAGVMAGFSTKLDGQRRVLTREGLVWVPHPGLNKFYRARHPRISSVRTSGQSRNEAYASGQAAGQSIVLSKPVTSSNDRRGGPRRLASKSS